MITYSLAFDSPDQADRAAAWLRSRGVSLQQYRTDGRHVEREPYLAAGYPYTYPTSLSTTGYTYNLFNGLPQTDGNAVIVALPSLDYTAAGRVRAHFTVLDGEAERARRILINSGGREVRIVQ